MGVTKWVLGLGFGLFHVFEFFGRSVGFAYGG